MMCTRDGSMPETSCNSEAPHLQLAHLVGSATSPKRRSERHGVGPQLGTGHLLHKASTADLRLDIFTLLPGARLHLVGKGIKNYMFNKKRTLSLRGQVNRVFRKGQIGRKGHETRWGKKEY